MVSVKNYEIKFLQIVQEHPYLIFRAIRITSIRTQQQKVKIRRHPRDKRRREVNGVN
jgi:hypothetical protein